MDKLLENLPSTSVCVVAAAAASIGFLAGYQIRGRESKNSRVAFPAEGRRRRDNLCVCGTLLPKNCTDEDWAKHVISYRHKRNLTSLNGLPSVVVCEEVGEYRAAAHGLLDPDDHVLEIGSHVGGTTEVLVGLCKKVIGLDQQPDLVARARDRLPNVQFENANAFDAQKVIALSQSIAPERFKKVFIDISGSRDITTVVRLMSQIENTIRPDMMIVKSQALKRLCLRSQCWVHHDAVEKSYRGSSKKGKNKKNGLTQ